MPGADVFVQADVGVGCGGPDQGSGQEVDGHWAFNTTMTQ
jgi:hypothetical protein